MTGDTEIFDGAATPLVKGITLIEASAGTGKTFAISMLVLRAVVELEIDIKEILVVTYTVAATEELRARIRGRLVEARNLLRAPESQADPVLKKWLMRINHKESAIRKLDLALLDVDSMGVHTIHGFCQRVLAEQVVESGHFFDTELISDTSTIRQEMIRDFWRRRLYEADERYGSLIVGRFSKPQDLYASIRDAENPLCTLLPEELSFQAPGDLLDEPLEQLKIWWDNNGMVLAEEFGTAAAEGYLNKNAATGFNGWLEQIETSFKKGRAPDPGTVKSLLEENLLGSINGRKVRGENKKRVFLSGWRLPGEVAERYLAAVDTLVLSVRLEMALYLRNELAARLHDQGLVSFDELIINLRDAIRSAAGNRLVRQVGSRFKVALIDEFQDTDAAQYEIFSRLFGQDAHHLYLIGDPKQAIYRFRGADIHSYLKARNEVNRRLTLDCNFRSHPGLVRAVNNLLKGWEIGGTEYNSVHSPESQVFGRLEDLDGERSGLIYCQLDDEFDNKGWSAGEAEKQIRTWVVNEVVRLVNTSSALTIVHEDDQSSDHARAVKPSDIGILVRTNRQAEDFFSEFSRRGIPVVLSSSKDVFQTREAADLLLVLRAVASPSDSGLLRTVLSLDWFGLSGTSFVQVCNEEDRFNGFREKFHGYHRQWAESGLLLMMNDLLESENVFLHLSRKIQAERRITNIQHLVELVQQQQGQRRLTLSQTLSWLQERLLGPTAAQEAELRLESDHEAVNVVTMHSAKGLEYEIVFCPYLFRSARSAQDTGTVKCFDPKLGRICDIGSADYDRHAQMSHQEEVDEEMRLAYVAITRARLCAYVIWADLKKSAKSPSPFMSPLGRLLFPAGECAFTRQQEHLRERGAADYCQYRLIEPDPPPQHYEVVPTNEDLLEAREYSPGRLQTNRIRTSFSGLTTLSKNYGDGYHKAGDESGSEKLSGDAVLPGGVRFGNLIHDGLEMFCFAELGNGQLNSGQLEALIRRYRYEIDAEPVRTLLYNAVSTPLIDTEKGQDSFTLAMVDHSQMVKEMEFTFHLEPFNTAELNRILAKEQTVRPLGRREIEGYLSGFVDLIFFHNGRYFIADYKTNNLGSEHGYRPEGLIQAMQEHNYGLQYWLYSLVVHRFLRNWFEDYLYDLHFGGVMYLFVRGMNPDKPGSGVFFDRPNQDSLMELDRCFGSGIE
ncbi:MAG: exodeoxyribonuclease V subunit beta [Desulfofustis sp.]|nr:exodeoxyribonuclease V subunit beta [Desulfofustis sp.]